MRRIQMVLAALVVTALAFAAFAAPAMAHENAVNEEKGESAQLQAHEENAVFSPLLISNGNFGFNGSLLGNNCGDWVTGNCGCNHGLLF